MELRKWIKGNVAETVIRVAASKVDMYKEGIKADALMDKQLGASASEKIQRGTLSGLLLQFLRGLYAESPQAYIATLKIEITNAKKKGQKR